MRSKKIFVVRLVTLILTIVLGKSFTTDAQPIAPVTYPVIGQPCPDFVFNNVINYGSKKISLADLKGQFFVLDFWARYCVGCLRSFPHSNEIQRKFEGKFKLILVGDDDKEGLARPLFKRIREREKLDLPCAFDSIVMKQFLPTGGLPSLLWVNDKGIVVAVTGAEDLTEWKVNQFIENKAFGFNDVSMKSQYEGRKAFDESKLFLLDGNGGSDTAFLYRSIFTRWKPGMGTYIADLEGTLRYYRNNDQIRRYQATKIDPAFLFMTAFFKLGDFMDTLLYRYPIFELRDSSMFFKPAPDRSVIPYCYSLQAPKNAGDDESFRTLVQNQLQMYFNCSAKIQYREIKCLFLKVIDFKKVMKFKSAGNKPDSLATWEHGIGGNVVNTTMSKLAIDLNTDLPDLKVIDRTGIAFKVDFPLFAITMNPNDLRHALNKYGLDLVPGKNMVKALVVSN